MTLLAQGSFTSAGVAVNIELPQSCDYFVAFNQTQSATTQATGRGVKFEWFGNPAFGQDAALETKKTNSTDALNLVKVTSGGFTLYKSYPQPEAAFVGTAITSATPAVASGFTGLPYSNGDKVYLYATTGMLQIGGMPFTISSVSTSGFTLLGLPAAGFAAAATAVTARRVFPFSPVVPEALYVTAISKAAQAQVTVSTNACATGDIYVGQKLVFSIPQSFGMVEMNTPNVSGSQDLPVVVTAIVDDYNFTVNVNSTAFTTFAFPSSALSPAAPLFAMCAPAGSQTARDILTGVYTGYDFEKQSFRDKYSFPLMRLAAGAQSPAGSSSDIITWQAWKAPVTFYGAS